MAGDATNLHFEIALSDSSLILSRLPSINLRVVGRAKFSPPISKVLLMRFAFSHFCRTILSSAAFAVGEAVFIDCLG